MTLNMGTTDRIIRAILGLALILGPFLIPWTVFSTQWVVYVAVAIGLVLGSTAIFGTCPIYRVFGFHTNTD